MPIGHQDPRCRTLAPQHRDLSPELVVKPPALGHGRSHPVLAAPCHGRCPSSQFRLVVKMALKLLLVFVEYTEPNALLLIHAVNAVDQARGECSPSCQRDACLGMVRHRGHVVCPTPTPCVMATAHGSPPRAPSRDGDGGRYWGCSALCPKPAPAAALVSPAPVACPRRVSVVQPDGHPAAAQRGRHGAAGVRDDPHQQGQHRGWPCRAVGPPCPHRTRPSPVPLLLARRWLPSRTRTPSTT